MLKNLFRLIKLEGEADCDEAIWCKIVSGNSKLTLCKITAQVQRRLK